MQEEVSKVVYKVKDGQIVEKILPLGFARGFIYNFDKNKS